MKKLIMSVNKELALKLEKYCEEPCAEATKMKSGTPIFDQEVIFPDGVVVTVQVITSRDDSCWTQAVAFKDGHEIGCESGDGFLGEYTIGDYVVEVTDD